MLVAVQVMHDFTSSQGPADFGFGDMAVLMPPQPFAIGLSFACTPQLASALDACCQHTPRPIHGVLGTVVVAQPLRIPLPQVHRATEVVLMHPAFSLQDHLAAYLAFDLSLPQKNHPLP